MLVRFGQKIFGFLVKAVVSDIDLFDKMIWRGRAPADEQHSASSCVTSSTCHGRTTSKRGQQHAGKTGLQPPQKIECKAFAVN